MLAPSASLDDLRKEETGFALHYRIATSSDSPAKVELDVSAWKKTRVASCGDYY